MTIQRYVKILILCNTGMGYQYEAIEIMKCLDEGRIQSDVVPHSFSRDLMATLDRIRQSAGIVFPEKRLNKNDGSKGRIGEREKGRMGEWEKGRLRDYKALSCKGTEKQSTIHFYLYVEISPGSEKGR